MPKVVIKHDRDGIRFCQPYLGINRVTGRPLRPYKRFPQAESDEEAAVLAERWMEGITAASKVGTSRRFGELMELYVSGLDRTGTSPNTIRTYRTILRCYVGPRIGSRTIDDLTPMDFAMLQDDVLEHGSKTGGRISGSTVSRMHWFLSGAFKYFCSIGLADSNPVSMIDKPSPGSGDATAYDWEEFEALSTTLESELEDSSSTRSARYRRNRLMAAWIALHTGLRVGEVCALRRCDVIVPRSMVSVSATVVEMKGKGAVRKPIPKTLTSRRNVSVTKSDLETIKVHVDWQRSYLGKSGKNTPICTVDGSFMRPSTVSRAFSEIRDEIGLPPDTSFHTLRHTHATWLLVSGMDPKTVAERLGHANVTTLLRLYAHVLPGRDAQAAEAFSSLSERAVKGL